MRSKIARRLLDETPSDVRIFFRKYGDVMVRVQQLLQEKGFTQMDFAEHSEKTPSEVGKWFSGDHDFTLQSIAKLEAELGEEIMHVPKVREA